MVSPPITTWWRNEEEEEEEVEKEVEEEKEEIEREEQKQEAGLWAKLLPKTEQNKGLWGALGFGDHNRGLD